MLVSSIRKVNVLYVLHEKGRKEKSRGGKRAEEEETAV